MTSTPPDQPGPSSVHPEPAKLTEAEATRPLEALESAVQTPPATRALWIAISVWGLASVALLSGLILQGQSLAQARSEIETLDRLARDAASGRFDELIVKRIAVVGDDDRPRILLYTREDYGVISTFNGSGGKLIGLGATENGLGEVNTFNAQGEKLVEITATRYGQGAMSTFNSSGEALVRLGITESSHNGTVITYNGQGENVVRISSTREGDGVIHTYNGRGNELIYIGVSEGGEGIISVLDPSGRRRRGVLFPE